MMQWCETRMDDKNKFEFATPPDTQEFELVGERQAAGKWKCTLNRYPGGTLNVSMPVQGHAVASFTADSPAQAKQLAEETLLNSGKKP
jgi:hypothetical protein